MKQELLFLKSQASNIDLTKDLKGYWKFDGNANDATGNGHHGTVNGSSLVVGKINQGYEFNGIDDWIDLSYNPGGDYSNLTLSMWAYAYNFNDFSMVLGSFNNGLTNHGLVVRHHSSGFWQVNDPGTNGAVSSDNNASLNKWVHLVAVINSRKKSMMYVDSIKQQDELVLTDCYLNDTFKVGWSSLSQANQYWDGIIDEVAIYRRTLTQEEINALYNDGNGLQYPF